MIPDFYNKELSLPVKSKVVTQPYIDFLCKKFKLSHNGFHGFEHWMRVLFNGRLIARVNGADIEVIEHFALIHDVMRTGESLDPNHGVRAAMFAAELWGKWIDLTEAQLELLKEACKKHSLGQITSNMTIQHFGGQPVRSIVSSDVKMTSSKSCNSSSNQYGAVIAIIWSGKVSL